MCSYKEFGGLGVTKLETKNRALLNKWLWRFSAEPDVLWCKVIVGQYGGAREYLMPNLEAMNKFSST